MSQKHFTTSGAFPRLLLLLLLSGTTGCAAGASTSHTAPRRTSEERIEIAGTASALEVGRGFTAVAEALRPTVVHIRIESKRHRIENLPFMRQTSISSGTGFIVRSDGYVVTNNHVIDGARQVFVRLFDQREYRASIVGRDPLTDIAVLKIEESELPVAPLGDSDDVRVGQWVLAIGNPLGSALSFSVTAGIVSATERALQPRTPELQPKLDFIQTDAVANSGNSGGPLIDLHGRIVGMNAAIFSTSGSYQGYTLAIPANLVDPVVDQLIRHGRMMRAGLGVSIEEATPEDAVAVGLESVGGVVVQDASIGLGLAAKAGLRAGDVIVALDGHPVTRSSELQQAVWFRAAGETVALTVRREEDEESVVDVPLVRLGGETRRDGGDSGSLDRPPPCSENPLGVCVVEAEGGMYVDLDTGEAARGLVVSNVYAVGPSFGKLVPDADIITHIDDRPVRTLADLDAILKDCHPGEIVSVRTYRHRTGERGFARVRLQG